MSSFTCYFQFSMAFLKKTANTQAKNEEMPK